MPRHGVASLGWAWGPSSWPGPTKGWVVGKDSRVGSWGWCWARPA